MPIPITLKEFAHSINPPAATVRLPDSKLGARETTQGLANTDSLTARTEQTAQPENIEFAGQSRKAGLVQYRLEE